MQLEYNKTEDSKLQVQLRKQMREAQNALCGNWSSWEIVAVEAVGLLLAYSINDPAKCWTVVLLPVFDVTAIHVRPSVW